MNEILSEKQYQKFILDYLKTNNGYLVRKDKDFDRLYAMDKELLFKFLNDTQPDAMDTLRKIYKADLETTLVNCTQNQQQTLIKSLLLNMKRISFQ